MIDATNPLTAGLSGLVVGTSTSGAEEIVKVARDGRVLKAFNTTGAENMPNPAYLNGQILMPVFGDDADARARVLARAAIAGCDSADVGSLNMARYLEPMAMVWIQLAIKQGFGRDIVFGRMICV